MYILISGINNKELQVFLSEMNQDKIKIKQ